jgi:hypothetical protein
MSANRIAHEGIWMTNIAYLLGYDGLTYNTTTRSFQPVNRASSYLKKNRIHVNKILPTIQNRLARLCKNPPVYDVRPESNSTEDKEAARLSLQILNAMWEKLSINKKRIFLFMWVQQCGHGWGKVSWDTTLGRPLPAEMGEDGEEQQIEYEGDVRFDAVSPFEVFPDPMAKTDDDVLSSWLVHAKVRKLDYFKAHYKLGHIVKEEGAWLLSAQYEQRINSLNNRGPSSSGMEEALKNSAIEMIKYEARSSKYPNGRMIVVANGVLLEDKELPVGEIPYRKFDDTIIAGKLYSESVITHLRPLQDNYNEAKRRTSEWMKRMLAGKYSAPRGSELAQEAMNDESGEIVLFTPVPNAPEGGRPVPIEIPQMPNWALNLQKQDVEDINDISGISEVSRGTLPSASIPAIGMQLLTEQDDTRIGVMTEQHEYAWSGIGSLVLKYIEKFYLLPRKLKISGPDLAYTVKEVTGDDISGNTDVIVIRGSTLPGSKTLDRQDIMNVYNGGLLGDPKDPKVREKTLDMLEFGNTSEIWQDLSLDKNQIKRVMDALEKGLPVNVSEFDNHIAWLTELNKYRKGDKWDTLSPEIQANFIDTMENCLQTLIKLNSPAQNPGMTAPVMSPTGPTPLPTAGGPQPGPQMPPPGV